MLRAVCEENGHLGFTVREALHAYLQGSRWEQGLKLLFNDLIFGPPVLRLISVPVVCSSRSMLQDRQEALAKYMLAAEAGLGSAQINAAHLCEVNL